MNSSEPNTFQYQNEQVLTLLRPVMAKGYEDERGYLGVCEFYLEVGFEARRFYYISEVADFVVRGLHAHKELKQVFICLRGSFKLTVHDGKKEESLILKEKSEGTYLKPGLWREMSEFSPDAICLVIASHEHDQNDYIHDFEDFLEWANARI